MDESLSLRGAAFACKSNILQQGFKMCLQDLYDKESNSQGFVNFGTSENKICFDLLHERLTRPDLNYLEPSLLEYNAPYGIKSLREEAAEFLSYYCQAPVPLNPDNIIILNGCNSIFCSLSASIFNPGDCFLIPTPYYNLIDEYIGAYTGVRPIHVPLSSKVTETENYPFQLTIKKLEDAMEEGKKEVNYIYFFYTTLFSLMKTFMRLTNSGTHSKNIELFGKLSSSRITMTQQAEFN
ncbi:1-aminocyclopropane-1-carboxylate synthase 1 [Pelobates cultripes]|uniref:1-aminocyclopropane-1-carboxylate synthase 1 n=1 Tax=Pelobates cultripes TaxID=61616 RepID=A0AAD1VZI8_PELCU|nr:1-aminocyclopropane-1-carboxylate synthase 1 [Pelobates cultripes]